MRGCVDRQRRSSASSRPACSRHEDRVVGHSPRGSPRPNAACGSSALSVLGQRLCAARQLRRAARGACGCGGRAARPAPPAPASRRPTMPSVGAAGRGRTAAGSASMRIDRHARRRRHRPVRAGRPAACRPPARRRPPPAASRQRRAGSAPAGATIGERAAAVRGHHDRRFEQLGELRAARPRPPPRARRRRRRSAAARPCPAASAACSSAAGSPGARRAGGSGSRSSTSRLRPCSTSGGISIADRARAARCAAGGTPRAPAPGTSPGDDRARRPTWSTWRSSPSWSGISCSIPRSDVDQRRTGSGR